jgi:hypothetical protein
MGRKAAGKPPFRRAEGCAAQVIDMLLLDEVWERLMEIHRRAQRSAARGAVTRALSNWAAPVIMIFGLAGISALWGLVGAGVAIAFITAFGAGWILGAGLETGDANEDTHSQARLAQPRANRPHAADDPPHGTDLTGADLTGADLTGADLTNLDLRGVNLSGAVLRGADLRGARLGDAESGDPA